MFLVDNGYREPKTTLLHRMVISKQKNSLNNVMITSNQKENYFTDNSYR